MADKIIKIFISSTFSDMHRERDLLHSMEGLINADIAYTGYAIQLIDLRYGIDTSECTEEEAERKVLDKCFGAIDQCQLFLLMMGDRYGTVFEEMNLSVVPLDDEEVKGKSVTHLEMTYGNKIFSPEDIMVLIRKSKNEEELPEQLRELRATILVNDQYRIDSYDDRDEYYFTKHAQGILETMVLDYIKRMQGKGALDGSFVKERNPELEEIIQQKSAVQGEQLRCEIEKLLHLRVEELLSESDYAAINRNGGSGKALLEHQKSLAKQLPEQIDDLLKYICEVIADIIGEVTGEKIYETLCLIAQAQNHPAFGRKGVTLKEIQFPWAVDYEQYQANKLEDSILYRKPDPIRRALAYFTSCNILVYNEEGYHYASDTFAEYMTVTEQADIASLEVYTNQTWWFVPGRVQHLVKLLNEGFFDNFYHRIEVMSYADAVTQKMKPQIEKVSKEVIRSYLDWCIDMRRPMKHVIYCLSCLYHPYDDQEYEEQWVKLCEHVYNRYKENDPQTLFENYILKYLYDHFSVEQPNPQPFVLDDKRTEELAVLDEALWDMFFYHHEAPEEAYCVILSYSNEWKEICEILQVMKFTQGVGGEHVMYNFLPLFLGEEMSAKDYQYLVCVMAKTGYAYDHLMNDDGYGICCILNGVMQSLVDVGQYEMAVFVFRKLQEMIQLERNIRCCDWTKWLQYMDIDLLYEIYEKIKDDAVGTVLEELDDLLGYEIDYDATDASLLEEGPVIED